MPYMPRMVRSAPIARARELPRSVHMAESLRELGWVMCSAGAGEDASVRVLDWGPWRFWQPVRGRALCVRSTT